MKYITLLVLLFGNLVFSQVTFSSLESNEKVTTMSINKEMFKLMAQLAESSADAKEYVELINGLENLKIISTEDTFLATKMKREMNSYLSSSNLSQLFHSNSEEGNIKVFTKSDSDEYVAELLLFVDEINSNFVVTDANYKPTAVIVSITGKIDLDKISLLTEQLGVVAGEHLRKIH